MSEFTSQCTLMEVKVNVSKFKQIEAQQGKPMNEILLEAYEQYGDKSSVAKHLGVSRTTVWIWLLQVGLQERTVLVPKKEVLVNENAAS